MCIDCIDRLFSLCVRCDDEVGEDTLLIQHVPLDDGASIIEHGDVVVRVKRSFKDSVRTTCDSDIYRSSIRRFFNLRWDVASKDVERRIIINFQHDLFDFKETGFACIRKDQTAALLCTARRQMALVWSVGKCGLVTILQQRQKKARLLRAGRKWKTA